MSDCGKTNDGKISRHTRPPWSGSQALTGHCEPGLDCGTPRTGIGFASRLHLQHDHDDVTLPFTLLGRRRTEIRRPADRSKVCEVYGHTFC